MVIISRAENQKAFRYGNSQLRYSMFYVLIILIVLLFLNLYCSRTSQDLFYQSKDASMKEKSQLVADRIGEQSIVNRDTVQEALKELENLSVTRLIVTDQSGMILFDSLAEEDSGTVYCLLPELVQALEGYDVFTSVYHDGVMESQAAMPILSYNSLVGCVYLMEYDAAQGALIKSLQTNIMTITGVLVLVVLIFSLIFAVTFSRRLRMIMNSIRVIREGDYTHKVEMRGHDELTVLGNEFNDLTDKLQESEEQRRRFVSDASHELKTPLASIKLLSDSILQNDMDMDTVREFVSDIGDEADRLNRMSYKLLTLSRVDPDSGEDCEIVYLGPTIARVVRMLSAIANKAQVTIRVDIVTDCSILILEDDLYQIIFNLVENGIKYNVPGGKLTIRLTRNNENAILQIRDTGMGIPESSLPHVFERFYRVDKARSRQHGGSGLGLAIVRDMVQRNRGQIQVESTVGTGTTFTVEFPVFDVEDDEP